MDAISSVLKQKQSPIDSDATLSIVPIGKNNNNQLLTIVSDKTDVKLTKEEVQGCDIALSQYTDLMHPDFYAWYCKAFYKIGRERFHVLASQARADGKNGGARLFSSLVKKEMAKS